ncbi:hypothetical protein D8674_000795 [Pyrus ussuriensis x Pyrus communis]|uniref:Uncharacterized protein n=1 Tax=Pyrus ussuriensis x Pyrus communis TaxID=2448454 RepID=A0A5N5F4H2_9ROSA|nr:hypothetical protein D8674_000795 [Pyrus ussuriensis x Pyrus communis]
MADKDARSSMAIDGEDPPLYGRSRYRITGDEIIGVVKSNKCASFSSDVGATVRTKCAADWESWKAIPEELKMHMIDELVSNWDIGKSDPNLMKVINNVFKSRFQEWNFDNERDATIQQEQEHHYELSNLDSNQMEYLNDLCSNRFTQWKSDLHKHYELYDGLEVALEVGQTRSIGRRKNFFTDLGHNASLIGWRYDFPKIDMFKEVYVRPGDELTEKASLRDPSASSSRQRTEWVDTLTYEVVGLKEQIVAQQSQIVAQNNFMNQIRLALQISSIQFPDLHPLSPPSQQPRPPNPLTQQQHHQPTIVMSRTSFFSVVLICFRI